MEIIKNILAILAGVVVGSIVNMALIIFGSQIISLPDGVDRLTRAARSLISQSRASVSQSRQNSRGKTAKVVMIPRRKGGIVTKTLRQAGGILPANPPERMFVTAR